MADASVVKIRIDSKEYDQELRKVTAGLTDFFEKARAGGASLDELEKGAMEAVQAFGRMDTAANSARGKASELTRAFTELHVQYQQMTDAEKSSPLGKEMSKSLDELRQRLENNRTQLDNATAALHGTESAGGSAAGVMEQLAQKFTVNIDAIKLFSMGLAAAKGALDVAKDAFFASEANVDEWGRTIASAQSAYDGFLTALNTGDISGYLGRIDQIVQAARNAYDELDRLGTLKTIQGPAISAQTTENERIRMMIRTGRYIAPIDGRKNAVFNGKELQNGQLLTPEQIRGLESKLQNGIQKVVGLVGDEVKQTGKAIDAVYERMAKELGMSVEEFRKGTSSMAEFDKRLEGARRYSEWEQKNSTSSVGMSGGLSVYGTGGNNPNEAYKGWNVFRVDGEKFNELVNLIKQRDQQTSQAYGMQSQAYQVINRAEGITTRKLLGGGGSGLSTKSRGTVAGGALPAPGMDVGGLVFNGYDTTQSMSEMQAMLQTYQKALKDATTQAEYEAATAGIDRMNELIEAQPIALKMGVSAETVADWREEAQKRMDEIEPIKIGVVVEGNNPLNSGKKIAEDWKDVAGAIQAVGSAMSQIEDPAAKVMGTIAQAIATVALTFSKSLAGTVTPWDWIAAAAAGTATMLTTINAIKTATAGSYAEGGIVPGNNYSDGLIAHVSSGELILNKAQQNAIASQLTQGNGDGEGLSAQPFVSGEMIFLGLNNYLRRTGRGEILTAR